MNTINILSSDATTSDGVAYAINAETGVVIQITAQVDDLEDLPVLFNLREYRNHYGRLDGTIDIMDIGYTTHSGKDVPPDPEVRMRIMRDWWREAMQHLETVTTTLEECLADHGKNMATGVLKAADAKAHTAREFMHRINYETDDDEPGRDQSVLPAGVVGADGIDCACDGCGEPIKPQDKVLVATIIGSGQAAFCTRECLDRNLPLLRTKARRR